MRKILTFVICIFTAQIAWAEVDTCLSGSTLYEAGFHDTIISSSPYIISLPEHYDTVSTILKCRYSSANDTTTFYDVSRYVIDVPVMERVVVLFAVTSLSGKCRDTSISFIVRHLPNTETDTCLSASMLYEAGFRDTAICNSPYLISLPEHIDSIYTRLEYSDTAIYNASHYAIDVPSDTNAVTVDFTVTSLSGRCKDTSITFVVSIIKNLTTPFLPNDTTLCPNDTLNITFSDTNGYYSWSDGGPFESDTLYDTRFQRRFINDTLKLSSFVYFYEVTFFHNDCPLNPVKDSIYIYYATPPKFSLMNDTVICRDSGYVLEALDINFYPEKYDYRWVCPTSEREDKSFYTADSGWYKLNISLEQCGLLGKDSVYLEYVPLFWTDINLPQDTFLCDKTSLLLDLSTGHDSTMYLWLKPSDTTLSFDTVSKNATMKFEEKNVGIYTIVLRDEKSCHNRQSIAITNDPCTPLLDAPNVFTPNGDGINDIFKIKTADYIYQFAINIYDRWGVLVYKYNGDFENFSWDGTHFGKGRAVPDGPYFYVTTFKDARGKNKSQAGSIAILR
ncbi:MAG: gliding motility-associated C-terminal domain-containing protein [Bacteroidales bacterium]|jgi:gliding motility-associated-like protein|nr:gliding motility-associated C-terminal domain-containing protein [Bacteroidales bacterium]